MRKEAHQKFDWSGNVEQLEEKIVMSADPLGGLLGGQIQHHAIVDELPPLAHHSFDDGLPPIEHHAADNLPPIEHHLADGLPPIEHHQEREADFWIDYENLQAIEEGLERIEQTLSNAHDQSGMTDVTNDYGFDGTGQTVAVIDSGIAYDHFALGGGYGANYRVVGGWDFTENDADPYDDGAAGSHGTHVSGIVGARGGPHEGVAPGVDLVGLRVFNDAGDGYFSWVENALQWVYDNKDSFENPITAVNLSLGVASYNADSIPLWANLENEFQQLTQAGIFISVSAGNSFGNFNETGLSYPAASPHVVPVASVDDSGLMSYYSQRNSRVIAAPGRGIYSTVPDYKGNNNGTVDDYASFSGTSMAAPYVAGASVIIREAMEFVGYTDITQDTIYNHMISTADSFLDSATNAYYNRLNMDAAIDALMPTDDFGSTLGSAFNVGTLGSDESMSGVISTLDDVDYFKFTASATGSVSFTVSNLTHDLTADWTSDTSGVWSGANNETFTIDVVAGQEYTVGFSSDDGLGYYDLDITSEASEAFTYTDWGAHSFSTINGVSNTGENWYRVVANNTGYFTAQALFNAGGGQLSLEIYNANLESIAAGSPSGGEARVDAVGTAGTEFFLKVTGNNSDIDFRLTNLVAVSGTVVGVAGTSGNDAFTFDAGSTHQLTVNGTSYTFHSASVSYFAFDGGAGNDSMTMTGTSGSETATLRVGQSKLVGTGLTVESFSTETNTIHGGGGADIAIFHDSEGDDTYIGWADRVSLTGNGYTNEAHGFGETHTYATTGQDRATFYDSAGNDVYVGRATRAELRGTDYDNSVYGFDNTRAYSSTGHDHAVFYDSAGDDVYVAWADRALITGTDYYNDAYGFERTLAYSSTGNDKAVFHDSAGDDIYVARSDRTSLSGANYYNTVYNFATTETYGTTGNDRAIFYDTAGNDVLVARVQQSSLRGAGYFNRVWNFGTVDAYASGGYDIGILYDSDGDDVYVGRSTSAYLRGEGYKNTAYAFERTITYASGGHDIAVLYDSAGDDIYVARAERTHLVGDGFYNDVRNFNHTLAYSSTGNDRVVFHDTSGNDTYVGWSNRALMTGENYYNDTRGFNRTEAYATTGNDRAVLHDSANDDSVHAVAWGAYIGDGQYHNEAHDFDTIAAYSTHGGSDVVAEQVDALDYAFSTVGDWS